MSTGIGVSDYYYADGWLGSSPTITGNQILNNGTGVSFAGMTMPIIHANNVTGNIISGLSYSGANIIDVTNNNWGSVSGPRDDSDDRAVGGLYNPSGQGDRVSDNVNYYPWTGMTGIGLTAVPTGLAGTVDSGVIDLTWTGNTEAYLGGYKVYHGTVSGVYGNPTMIGTNPSYRLTGLSNGIPYYVAISSLNSVGLESAKSGEVVFTPHCTSFAVDPLSKSVGSAGVSGVVTVATAGECTWTASSAKTWITIDSGASGSGPGSVGYTVRPNNGTTPRTGKMTIAGKTFTVNQAPMRTLAVTKVGSGSGAVTANAGALTWSGGTGSKNFHSDLEVTLAEAPNSGSIFDGWEGEADCRDGQLTMDANKACGARFTASQCVTAPDGLFSWWTAQNVGEDLMGAYPATLMNGAFYAAGRVGQAFALDGVDDFVDAGDVDLPAAFTIGAWILPGRLDRTQNLFSKDDGDTQRSYSLALDEGGYLTGFVRSADGLLTRYRTVNAAVIPAEGLAIWRHVAFVYDGNAIPGQKMLFYVNGVLAPAGVVSDADNGGVPESNPLTLKFGIGGDGVTEPLQGRIDEVEIVARALSLVEVRAIHDAGSVGNCISVVTLDPIGNKTIAEGSLLTFTVSGHDPGGHGVSYAIDPLPAGAILDGSTGSFSWTPGYDQAGPFALTFSLTDGMHTDSESITITVSNTNRAPVAENQSQIVLEDAPLGVTLAAVDADGDPLTYTVVTGPVHGSLVGMPPNLTYQSVGNYNGADSFTFTSNDGLADSNTATVTIAVTAVNDAPGFTKGGDKTVLEDSGARTVAGWATAISSGPANEVGQTLSFTVANDNNALFGAQPAVAANGTLTYTPAANAHGSATITVTLKDNGGTADGGVDASAPQTFTITVTPVNDIPSFTKGANQVVLEDAGAQVVTAWTTLFSPGPANEAGQALDFIVTNSNNALFSAQPAISSTGTLSYTPAPDVFGVATVTVKVHDNGGTANGGKDTSVAQTFKITVSSVNDAPSFTMGVDPVVPEDAGAQSIAAWATGISAGPANENAQTLTFTTTNNNNALFSVQPAIALNGALSFTPAANAAGVATVSVVLKDNGGTANSGVNSTTKTFPITVTAVSDAPVLGAVGNRTVDEGRLLAFTLAATDGDGNTLTFSSTALPAGATLNATTGAFSWTPAFDQAGSYPITFTVTDDGTPNLTDSKAITVTVHNVITLPSPWVGSVSIASDKNLVTVARPHIGAEVASYDGSPAGAKSAYLPMHFKNAFGGTYSSALYVQNVQNVGTANIVIRYYNSSNGALKCTVNDTVDPLASKGYWLPSLACLPEGWVGGIVVTSDQPVVAIGRPHIGTEIMTYDAFSSGSLISYLPMLFKDAFGGSYDAAFYVQNVHATATAAITMKFYDSTGTLSCTKTDTILRRASKGYWLPGETCLPAGWVGGVVVTSDQPIVTVARPHVGDQITTYNGFAAGGAASSVPMLFKGAFGGSYNSAFYIQNVSAAATANLAIAYYDSTGILSCTVTDTLAALASRGYWVPGQSCLPAGWVGGVVVTSDQPIVAVGRPHIGTQVTTYNGFTSGSLKSYLPMLFSGAFGGSYNSAIYIQNTEASAADVTITFNEGGGALTCTRSDSIPARSTLGLWLPSLTCSQ